MGAQIFMPFLDPIRPQLSAAYAVDDHRKLRLLFGRALQIILWLSVVIASVLALFGKIIFMYWTLGKIPFDPVLFRLLLASSIFYGVSQVQMLFLASIARHQILSAASFILIASAIGAAWVIGSDARRISGALLCSDICIALLGALLVRRIAPEAANGTLLAAISPPFWLVDELRTVLRLGMARFALR